MDSKFSNKPQIAISGTDHTITTDKNKIIHRKLISNPLPFQVNTPIPTKRIATRSSVDQQPCCSKTIDQQTNRRKEAPGTEETKKTTAVRNEKGQFTSPKKRPDAIDLNLSIVSDDEEDEFDCYNKSDGKPVHTFSEDEIRIHVSEEWITPEPGSIKRTNKLTDQIQSPRDYHLPNKPKNSEESPTFRGKTGKQKIH